MRSDTELFAAWLAGDVDSGSELFDRHARSLYWFFRNKVGDAPAEDLVQDCFLACVRARDRFRGDSSFRTYLFTVARSHLTNYLQRVVPKLDRIDAASASIADLGLSPTGALHRKRENGRLLAALQRLPLDLQIAIELHYFEGLSGRELAAALDVPEGTVRTRLRRARQLLEDALSSLGPDGPTSIDDFVAWARRLRGDASE